MRRAVVLNNSEGFFGEGLLKSISPKPLSGGGTKLDGAFRETLKRIGKTEGTIESDDSKPLKGSFLERYRDLLAKSQVQAGDTVASGSDFYCDKSNWMNRKNFESFSFEAPRNLSPDYFSLDYSESSPAVSKARKKTFLEKDISAHGYKVTLKDGVKYEKVGFGVGEKEDENSMDRSGWKGEVSRLREIVGKISRCQDLQSASTTSMKAYHENRDLFFDSLKDQVLEIKRSQMGSSSRKSPFEEVVSPEESSDGNHPALDILKEDPYNGDEKNLMIVAKKMETPMDPGVKDAITVKALMQASVHIGHNVKTFNRTMLPFVLGQRESLAIIDLEKTLFCLRRAIQVVRETARLNKVILFVGSRRFITKLTRQVAIQCDQFYINEAYRAGSLSNVTLTTGSRLLPDLVICLNMTKDSKVLFECHKLMIPTIAISDTDCNASFCTYPIPANDDSLASVALIANALSYAAIEGRDIAQGKNSSIKIPDELSRLSRKKEVEDNIYKFSRR